MAGRWITRENKQVGWLGLVETILSFVEDLALGFSCLCLFLIMLVKTADVTLRYVFNSPLEWSYGLTAHYLLLGAFFLSLPYTYRVGGHVKVDILLSRCSERYRTLFALIDTIVSSILFLVLAYEGIVITHQAWLGNEVMSEFYNFYTWTSVIVLPIGISVLDTRIALKFINILRGRPYSPKSYPFFVEHVK